MAPEITQQQQGTSNAFGEAAVPAISEEEFTTGTCQAKQ